MKSFCLLINNDRDCWGDNQDVTGNKPQRLAPDKQAPQPNKQNKRTIAEIKLFEIIPLWLIE